MIVHDVLKAAIVVVIGSLHWNVQAVAAGAGVAVLDVALLAWGLQGADVHNLMFRVMLHFILVLLLFGALLLSVPTAPALLGFSALLLGIVGRSFWFGLKQWRNRSFMETV